MPAGMLSSLIIGAGMFALPFVFVEAGFAFGFLYLIFFTAAFMVIHRMYAEIIESTTGKHRFVGYARKYLGKWGFVAAIITTAIGFVLVLTAYISLAGGFLRLVLPQVESFHTPYLFWILGSLAVVVSLRRLVSFELGVTLAMGLIVIFLLFAGLNNGREAITPIFNLSNIFVPYGVILFALSGRAAISSIVDYYDRNKLSKDKLKRSMKIGIIMPAITYTLFIFAVFKLSNGAVSTDSLLGLLHISPFLLTLIGGLGVFALWTSYLFLGLELRDILRYDLKFRALLAIAVVVLLPIFLYIAGLTNFIRLIGVIGGIFLAAESVLVVLMHSRIKGWSISGKILVVVFAVGAFYVAFQAL